MDNSSTKRKNKKKSGKKRRKASNGETLQQQQQQQQISSISPSLSSKSKKRKLGADSSSSSFLDKMRARLSGGHFRMLNEKLYTCSGKEAFDYFNDDPDLFNVYHTGYKEQMSHWPEQPVNIIIKWLKNRNSNLTVADFGCGDARIAKSVKNKVFSIDLVSNDPSVIACDMSQFILEANLPERLHRFYSRKPSIPEKFKIWFLPLTPLESSTVDVAIFCLSLMGTTYSSYINEANRVLKPCGWLLIAEVKSRFDPNNGGANPDEFIKAVNNLGFTLISKDMANKMFILFYFKKKEKTASGKNISWPELKPCIYKRR